jgi:hypothetical protein
MTGSAGGTSCDDQPGTSRNYFDGIERFRHDRAISKLDSDPQPTTGPSGEPPTGLHTGPRRLQGTPATAQHGIPATARHTGQDDQPGGIRQAQIQSATSFRLRSDPECRVVQTQTQIQSAGSLNIAS